MTAVPRYLLIVSRRDQVLYNYLEKRFVDDREVAVIVDRRHRQRGTARATGLLTTGECRRDDRRRNPEIDGRVAMLGAAVVRVDRASAEPPSGSCRDAADRRTRSSRVP
jgi:hypothetical protein